MPAVESKKTSIDQYKPSVYPKIRFLSSPIQTEWRCRVLTVQSSPNAISSIMDVFRHFLPHRRLSVLCVLRSLPVSHQEPDTENRRLRGLLNLIGLFPVYSIQSSAFFHTRLETAGTVISLKPTSGMLHATSKWLASEWY